MDAGESLAEAEDEGRGIERFPKIQSMIPAAEDKDFSNREGIEMVRCEKGTFIMGSAVDEKWRQKMSRGTR